MDHFIYKINLTATTKHNPRVDAQKMKGKQSIPPWKSSIYKDMQRGEGIQGNEAVINKIVNGVN